MRSLAQNGSTNSLHPIAGVKPVASLQRIAEALNRSEAYLATAQRLTQTGSWAIHPSAERASYWSEETFRIYECSSSEGPRSPEQLFEMVHPEDRDHYARVVAEGMASEGDWSVEFRIVLPSGRVKHIHAIAHPILDESGSAREWVGAIVDVSQRRTAEEALERSQVELRTAMEAIPAMVWTAEPDGTNAFVSRRWAEYAGLPAGQIRITAWEDVVHPDDRARATANWAHSVETGDPFEEELRLRRAADGSYRWFLDRGVAIRGKDGAVLKWYGVATDIDDRKQAEQERDRVQRLEIEREAAIAQERSRLAGEIHDTLAQGLAMIVMQVADAEAKLGAAWSLAEKPLSTVRELAVESLAFARRSLNTLQPRATMVDLSVTLQDVVNKLKRRFEGSISLSVAGSPVRIDPAVESALAGIASEALTNAVKHSKAMRIVAELDFAKRGGVRIVVSDDGVGFDANDVRADAYGLVSMQERATRARVALTFVTEPGAGTTIVASWSQEIVTGV